MSCHQGAQKRVFSDFADGLLVAFCDIGTRIQFGPVDLDDGVSRLYTSKCLDMERVNLRRAFRFSR